MKTAARVCLAIALSVVGLPSPVIADEHPSANDLLRQEYKPIAAGYLTMKRVFIIIPRWTGFTTRSDEIVSMSGEGDIPEGEVQAVLGREGVFVRLARGSEEYVCILYKTDACHRAD